MPDVNSIQRSTIARGREVGRLHRKHVVGGAMRIDLSASLVADLSGTTVARSDDLNVAAEVFAEVRDEIWPHLRTAAGLTSPCRRLGPTLDNAVRVLEDQQWRETILRAVTAGPG